MAAQTETWEIDGREIELSNSDKVLYPGDGYSKHDIVEYFPTAAAVMVPHLRGKPVALRRFPDGINAEGFFQKEASGHFPSWVRVESVPRVGPGNPVHHVVCDDAATLVYLATQACLEFHVFLSTMDDLDAPVVAVIDLDPPRTWNCRICARSLKAYATGSARRPWSPMYRQQGARASTSSRP